MPHAALCKKNSTYPAADGNYIIRSLGTTPIVVVAFVIFE